MTCRARAICISSVSRTVRGKPSSATAGGSSVGAGAGGGVSRSNTNGGGLGAGTGVMMRGTGARLVCGATGASGAGGRASLNDSRAAGSPGSPARHHSQPANNRSTNAANRKNQLPRFLRAAGEWFRRRGGTRGFSHSRATHPSLFGGCSTAGKWGERAKQRRMDLERAQASRAVELRTVGRDSTVALRAKTWCGLPGGFLPPAAQNESA